MPRDELLPFSIDLGYSSEIFYYPVFIGYANDTVHLKLATTGDGEVAGDVCY